MSSFIANALVGECGISRKIIQPVVSFGARFYVAYVFFKSGLNKVDDKFMVTADTVGFFKDDYKVPVLSPEIAANLAAYSELLLPILLVFGFLTRPAALALFILNAVALYSLYTAGWAQPIHNWIHAFYGAFLLMIFAYGPSKVSIDSWISDKMKGRETNLLIKLVGVIAFSVIGYFLLNTYA